MSFDACNLADGPWTAKEHAADLHRLSAAGTSKRVGISESNSTIFPISRTRASAFTLREELPSPWHQLALHRCGKQPVVTDLDEVLGWDMLYQAVDEVEHGTTTDSLAPIGIVVVEEIDVLSVVAQDAHCSDGRAACVAHAVSYGPIHLLKARPDRDPPALLGHADQKGAYFCRIVWVSTKRWVLEQASVFGVADFRDDVLLPLPGQIDPPNKRTLGCVDPTTTVWGQAPRCDNDMDMRIEFQITAKGMADSQKAGPELLALSSHVLAIESGSWLGLSRGQREERLGSRAIQGRQQDALVVADEVTKFFGQREDEMAIRHVKHLAELLVAPVIGSGGSTRRAERGFAAMGDQTDDSTRGAQGHVTSEQRGSAGQHPGNNVSSPGVDRVIPLPCQIALPVVLVAKDVGDRDWPSDDLHGDRKPQFEIGVEFMAHPAQVSQDRTALEATPWPLDSQKPRLEAAVIRRTGAKRRRCEAP